MKNKIALGGIVFLSAFFAFPSSAFTEEEIMRMTSEPVVVDETGNSQENQSSGIAQAPIKVRKVEAIGTDKNKFSVEFDLENGASAQKGLKYSISLNEILVSDGQEYTGNMAYEKIYDDLIDLAPNEKIHKKTEFEIPDYLGGRFQLWVEVRTEKALTLGMMVSTSKMEIEGTEKYIDLKNCFLYIDGEQDKKYGLSQGVDISKNEKLYLSCEAENSFDEAVSVVPKIETYYRSTFGKKEESSKLEAMAIGPKEKKNLVYEISKMSEPQAYDAVFSLRNPSDEKDLSKRIAAHYVVQGMSATIQNYGLDKSDYKRGDVANLEVFITPSADGFPDSRGGGTKSDGYLLETLIIDGSNNECSQKASQEVQPDRNNEIWKISVLIGINCPGAKAVISIKDKNGKFLDGENEDIVTSDKAYRRSVMIARIAKILIVLFLIIIAAYLIFSCFKCREKGRVIFQKMFILFFIGSGLISGYLWTSKIQAFSGSMNRYINYVGGATFYFSSDKDIYGSGENMIVVAWFAEDSWCNNSVSDATMYAIINGQNKTFFSCSGPYGTYCAWSFFNDRFDSETRHFSQNFTAPSSQGTYSAYFWATTNGGGWDNNGRTYIDSWAAYQVINPPRTSCATVSPSPAQQREGEDSKIFLSFTGSDPENSSWLEYYITYWDPNRYSNGSECSDRGRREAYGDPPVYYEWNFCPGGYVTVRSGQISGANYPYTFQWPELTSGTKNYTVKVCRTDGVCSSVNSCSFDLNIIKNNYPVVNCPAMSPSDPLNVNQTSNLTFTANDADHDPIQYNVAYCSHAYDYSTNPTNDIYCGDAFRLHFYYKWYNSDWISSYGNNYRYETVSQGYPMEGIMHMKVVAIDDHGARTAKFCDIQVGSQRVTLTSCPNTLTSHSWRYAPEVGREIPMSRPGNYTLWTSADIKGATDDPMFDWINRYGYGNKYGMKFYLDWNRDGIFEQVHEAGNGYERFWWEYTTSGLKHDVPQGVSFYNIKACDKNNNCSNTLSCYVAAYNDLPYASPACPTVSPSSTLNINEAGTFNFSTRNSSHLLHDPDGDYVKYFVNWGDGSAVEDSGSLRYDWNINFRPTHSWNSGGTKTYTWYGIDGVGGTSPTYSCTVDVQQPDPIFCGTATSEEHCSVPTSNLCVNNTNTPAIDSSDLVEYKWTCSNSGGSVDCSALKHCAKDDVWKEIGS